MSPSVTLRFDALALDSAADRLLPALDRELHTAMQLSADAIAAEARTTTSFKDRSGNLRASIQPGPVEGRFSTGDLRVDVLAGGAFSGVRYAEFVEFGTDRMVGRRFLRDALDTIFPRATEIIQDAVQLAIEEAGL